MKTFHNKLVAIGLLVSLTAALCPFGTANAAAAEEITDSSESLTVGEAKFNEYIEELSAIIPEVAAQIMQDEELVQWMSRDEYWLTDGEAKFNEYIEELSATDPQGAALIMQDEELVQWMSRDEYWLTDEENNGVSVASTTSLPLSEYPAGSYFSYNGKACTCHGSCSPTIPDSSDIEDRCYISSDGSFGNCKRYNGAIQCMGFAHYVFNKCTDTDCKAFNSQKGLSVVNEGSAKYYFTSVVNTKGSHVRGALKSGDVHSFVLTNVTSKGISYYQANYGGKCKVSTGTKTWSELADWFSSFSIAWVA